ncbi:MAG: serine acetyltransferase [Chitinophagia bacterium]|jgi:sugar O-acyltransferase (sialic acid O-acetyltransferase NeuD family)|nr:serine acetyltransferase [Chitinophagia bacterium]
MQDIAIYGAGGFGKEVACVLDKINEKEPTWNLLGFFDDGLPYGTPISRFGNVLGNCGSLNEWKRHLAIVFAIGNPKVLELLVSKIQNPLVHFPNIIHPEVFFADSISFTIGKGNLVVRGCSFSVDVTVGDFNQFNSISALAHDVSVGSYNVFMPLTRVSGETQIGNSNVFGLNTLILQGIKIGDRVRTGPGAVLMTKPKDGNLYMGNPARKTIL